MYMVCGVRRKNAYYSVAKKNEESSLAWPSNDLFADNINQSIDTIGIDKMWLNGLFK